MTFAGDMGGSALDSLAKALPPGALLTDPDLIEGYRFDRSNAAHAGKPVAVVRTTCTSDVQETLRWASANRIPVVPRGAGTGLAGGSLAVDGCVVLSTEKMRAITIDPPAGLAVVQPGALNAEVKASARAHGLWYPPDPSSFEICSIGGNVATNAGGLCCVKYGVTTDYVLGIEVVLADGRALRLGGRTIKDVAGYDLKRLFVGSEGTLGVVTEATLRLRPLPPPAVTMVATFADVGSAGRAISTIAAQGRPAALELMDQTSVQAVEARMHMGLEKQCGALLLGQSDAGGDRAAGEVEAMVAACQAEGALDVAWTDDESEGEQFMVARRMAIPAVEALGTVLIEDVGVPIPQIAELVRGVERVADRCETTIATIGHAGDGNFHPLVVFDRSDERAVERAERAFGEVMELALALGGTITGEHGVGSLKRPWLAQRVGDDVMAITRQIKSIFDPLGILNPGKAL
ncbi:MAG: FAD-binding protein [Actinobacteria bacterium]|nr:FAD-binding protein [Actinomycetota bacterium]